MHHAAVSSINEGDKPCPLQDGCVGQSAVLLLLEVGWLPLSHKATMCETDLFYKLACWHTGHQVRNSPIQYRFSACDTSSTSKIRNFVLLISERLIQPLGKPRFGGGVSSHAFFSKISSREMPGQQYANLDMVIFSWLPCPLKMY